MDKYESIPVPMPNKYIEASAGFTLDIGCSTAKIMYRSKEDYANGKPLKEELKGDMGRIFLIPSIARTKLDDVIELIRTKCDLRRPADGTATEIYSTGAGCNLFGKRLESELGISLVNANEMECFSDAFVRMSKSLGYDELFIPLEDKTVKDAVEQERLLAENIQSFSTWGVDTSNLATADDIVAEKAAEKTVLPCIVAMCGSGVAFLRILEDGTFNVCGIGVFGGRSFLGLVSLLSDERDYTRIMEAVERGTCHGVDEYGPDLVESSDTKTEAGAKGEEKSGDSYQKVLGGFSQPIFPFGKAATRSKDQFKKDDILHSLYRSFLMNLVNGARSHCHSNGFKNFYFCGNFVQNPRARNFIAIHNAIENGLVSKELRVHVNFIKNGGHLGAIGAFLKRKDNKN